MLLHFVGLAIGSIVRSRALSRGAFLTFGGRAVIIVGFTLSGAFTNRIPALTTIGVFTLFAVTIVATGLS